MKTIDFIKLVAKMREVQKTSAKSNCSIEHRTARKLEEEVDRILFRVKIEKEEPQIQLFK